jgi:hypothetical protein
VFLKRRMLKAAVKNSPGVTGLSIVSPACFIGLFYRICPVGFLQRLHGRGEIPSQTVKDIDEAPYSDARHLAYPPHGDAVEVVHDGNLRGNIVPVKRPSLIFRGLIANSGRY